MFNRLATANQRISPGLRKIIGNAGWLFADRVLRMGVGLLVGVWVARYLGPEQFGLYNYALAFVSLFSAFATLGLDSIVVRDIVHDPACKEEILGTAFVLKLAGGIVTLLLAVGIAPLLSPNDNLTHWLVGIIAAGTIFQSLDTIDLWFQSQVQSKYTVYAKNTAFVFITFVKIALIQIKAPLISFAYAGLVEIGLGAVGLLIAYWKKGFLIQAWQVNILRAKRLLSESWPLIMSSMVIIIYMRIDQIMITKMISSQENGYYSAAVKMVEPFFFISGVITQSILPTALVKSNESLKRFIVKYARFLIWIAIALTVINNLFATFLVEKLYGKSYSDVSSIFRLLMINTIFIYFSSARGIIILKYNLFKYDTIFMAISALVNIWLNYIFIPAYGAEGAVFASIISQILANVVLPLFSRKTSFLSKIFVQALLFNGR